MGRRLSVLFTVLGTLAATTPAFSIGEHACVLHEHRDNIVVQLAEPPMHEPIALFGGKINRDALGTFPNEVTSTNFVVKWGPDQVYSTDSIDRMLQGFELGWQVLIQQMQFGAPTGTDTYRMNVYIGNTGGNSPAIPDYAGGYADIDVEGYPIMVIHPQMMPYYESPGYEEYGDQTMIHEFFHTVQFSSGAYTLANQDAYWFWEATAEWAAAQAQPNSQALWGLIGGYALYPHVALNFFDYPDSGALIELHHYGAGIFPQYISEKVKDWTVIRDVWVAAGPNDDPIDDMEALLAQDSIVLGDVFTSFAAANATWDYARGPLMASLVDYYASSYPAEDHRIVATIPSEGTDGFVGGPSGQGPASYAYNTLQMNPKDGDVRFTVRAQTEPAPLQATVVRDSLSAIEYVPLENGELLLEDVSSGERLYLVIAAVPSPYLTNLTYPYEYSVEMLEAENPDDNDGPVGCVCAVTHSGRLPSTGWLALLGPLGLVWVVRRKQRS